MLLEGSGCPDWHALSITRAGRWRGLQTSRACFSVGTGAHRSVLLPLAAADSIYSATLQDLAGNAALPYRAEGDCHSGQICVFDKGLTALRRAHRCCCSFI